MTLFKNKYRVETTRLAGWDYGAEGCYFVTICTHERACFLGEICGGGMALSPQGIIVAEEWQRTETMRNNVALDAWVIMPNHFHAIIALQNSAEMHGDNVDANVETHCNAVINVETHCNAVINVETHCNASLQRHQSVNKFGPQRNNLASIIRGFKGCTTKRIREEGHDFGWQTRYYEQIVRNDKSLREIREYINNNPLKWEMDKNHPKNL